MDLGVIIGRVGIDGVLKYMINDNIALWRLCCTSKAWRKCEADIMAMHDDSQSHLMGVLCDNVYAHTAWLYPWCGLRIANHSDTKVCRLVNVIEGSYTTYVYHTDEVSELLRMSRSEFIIDWALHPPFGSNLRLEDDYQESMQAYWDDVYAHTAWLMDA